MSFVDHAETDEFSILTHVVDAHCLRHRIGNCSAKRERVSAFVVQLFDQGIRDSEELAQRLEAFHGADDVARRRSA